MKEQLFHEYEKYLEHDKRVFSETRKRIRLLSVLRFLAFCVILSSFFFFNLLGNLVSTLLVAVAIVLFFYWIKKFIQNEKKKQFYRNLIEINQMEILAVSENYSQFEVGAEFKNLDHHYSNDLDLFGDGSIFQFVNRTTTQLGRKKLAHYLTNPLLCVEEMRKRQGAVNELAKYLRWRQFFSAKGQTHDEDDFKLLKLLGENLTTANWKRLKWVVYILPVFSFCLLVLLAFSIIPWPVFLLVVLVNVAIIFSYNRVISSFYNRFGRQSKILQSYLELLFLIEKKEFKSELLLELKSRLYVHEKSASKVFVELKKIMGRFDYRANFLFAIVAEPLFVWDLICIYQLHNWQKKYKSFFIQCFDVIAEFDALSSFANLNYNHPDWTLPTFVENDFHYAAKDLAHPLISSRKRIGNSFQMDSDGEIAIITGANMAGKSTFLRALGVNFVLAMNGCHVCASSFTIKPAILYTNMRTTDNLGKDESYFFAELLRLQHMLERIRKGEKLFLLIDEMLKGTNSHDKLSGSRELIKQLIQLNANGVVATHDLELTRLAEDYPQNIRNLCFDVTLNETGLTFDYSLKKGVTSTMNASFLMRKMGIISG